MRNAGIDPTKRYWWSESMGRFELQIPGEAILDIFQPGANDEAVAYWAPEIERPAKATPEALRASLKEYGAWEPDELADDAANWERVVWTAACDLGDNPDFLDEV